MKCLRQAIMSGLIFAAAVTTSTVADANVAQEADKSNQELISVAFIAANSLVAAVNVTWVFESKASGWLGGLAPSPEPAR